MGLYAFLVYFFTEMLLADRIGNPRPVVLREAYCSTHSQGGFLPK